MQVCLRMRSYTGGSVLDWMALPLVELGAWNRAVQKDQDEQDEQDKRKR